ncbi:MAG: hypothetical protein ACFBSE_18605 [Prochloraceae cyanobacterium]
MIEFKDFFPEQIEQKGFFADDKYETCHALRDRLAQWQKETNPVIINIETIELGDKDSEKTRFLAKEPLLYQFLRVWYKSDKSTNEQ